MKQIACIVFSTIFLIGCNITVSKNKTLISAEHLMKEYPDTALYILKNIDSSTLKSSADKALYSLLYVQAEDKNHIASKRFSQINVAINYYKDSKDEYHKMLSYYYMARGKEDLQEHSKAIVNLLKAEEAAKKINDIFYLGMIYLSLSDNYRNIHNNRESFNYAEKSYSHFQMSGYSAYIGKALGNIGKVLHNCAAYDRSIKIARNVAAIATVKQDTILLSDALRLLATSYIAKKDYVSAKHCYHRIRDIDNKLLSIDDCSNLGVAYLETGNIDSVKYIINILNSADTAQRRLFYQWNKYTGNYKEALLSLEKENDYHNKILHEIINQNVTETVSNYRDYEMQVQVNHLKHIRWAQTVYSIVIAFATITLLIIVMMIRRIRFQNKEIKSYMLLASNLHNLLKVKETEVNEIQDKITSTLKCHQEENKVKQSVIDDLFKQQFKFIDKLCSLYYEFHGTANEQHKIYAFVMTIVSGLSSDKKKFRELENFVNTYRGNLMFHFRETFPEMKESDCMLYLYSVVGFSARTISVFINEKLDIVYNRKSRLKQKISRSSTSEKDIFLAYLS